MVRKILKRVGNSCLNRSQRSGGEGGKQAEITQGFSTQIVGSFRIHEKKKQDSTSLPSRQDPRSIQDRTAYELKTPIDSPESRLDWVPRAREERQEALSQRPWRESNDVPDEPPGGARPARGPERARESLEGPPDASGRLQRLEREGFGSREGRLPDQGRGHSGHSEALLRDKHGNFHQVLAHVDGTPLRDGNPGARFHTGEVGLPAALVCVRGKFESFGGGGGRNDSRLPLDACRDGRLRHSEASS